MADRKPRDIPASVFGRLKNLRRRDLDFNRLLQRFVAERFLYRLSVSPEDDDFTLKGATLFFIWCGDPLRSTQDVDLVRSEPAGVDSLRSALESICAQPCPADGVVFLESDIRLRSLPIERGTAGGVVTATLRGRLGNAVLPLRVDVGFGDIITPMRERSVYPTLLDHPKPTLWTYPRETLVAEKFHGMVRFEHLHTRTKDIWDIAALAIRFPFDGAVLRLAIDRTFGQRGTVPTSGLPPTLRLSFYESEEQRRLWSVFHAQKTVWSDDPGSLTEAGEVVRGFLAPVWRSAAREEPFALFWPPGGPWASRDEPVGEGDGHD